MLNSEPMEQMRSGRLGGLSVISFIKGFGIPHIFTKKRRSLELIVPFAQILLKKLCLFSVEQPFIEN